MTIKRTSAAEASVPPPITRAALIAEERLMREPGLRPQSSLARVHLQLATLLDALVDDLCGEQPAIARGVYAKCVAAILADIEDTEHVTGEVLQ